MQLNYLLFVFYVYFFNSNFVARDVIIIKRRAIKFLEKKMNIVSQTNS